MVLYNTTLETKVQYLSVNLFKFSLFSTTQGLKIQFHSVTIWGYC